MREPFRHLTRTQISEIVIRSNAGALRSELAREFHVDRSTISYHINKTRQSYPEDDSVYALIVQSARRECGHPSLRCSLCGKMKDELRRDERQRLERYHRRLRTAGLSVE